MATGHRVIRASRTVGQQGVPQDESGEEGVRAGGEVIDDAAQHDECGFRRGA